MKAASGVDVSEGHDRHSAGRHLQRGAGQYRFQPGLPERLLLDACRARILQLRGGRVEPWPMKNSSSLQLSVIPSAHVKQMQ